ncbi:HpsJ family protein [Trichothermofontia sichuanensis B231]|uniref:HpsJ family protein n=1 Tax=Trichothermofontia sichuanensis TaxID=3045816 RepID=UPI002245756C|nr:HpsJ family protein [Trichothermofontia sichuanensis]UZQ55219.1 HpsJ family protein [Trichothermofontia sichuanensis B231]
MNEFSYKSTTIATILRVIGIAFVLIPIVNCLVLAIPYDWGSRSWQLNLIPQLVDQGPIPLLGIALFLSGSWMARVNASALLERRLIFDLRFWLLVLAAILGVFFLVLVPLHLSNVQYERSEALQQIQTEMQQAQAQLDAQLQMQLQQQRGRITTLLENPAQVEAAIAQGQMDPENAALLEQFKQDPKKIDEFLKQEAERVRNQAQQEIEKRRGEAESRAKIRVSQASLRTSVNGIVLALTYAIVGAWGLRALINHQI